MLGQDEAQRQGGGEGGVLRAVGAAKEYPGGAGGLFDGGYGIRQPFLVGHCGGDDHAEVHQSGAAGFFLGGLHGGAGIDQGACAGPGSGGDADVGVVLVPLDDGGSSR